MSEAAGEATEPVAELDPETAARRRAALRHVRKWGDPILRSRAREVTGFGDDLRDQIGRMGLLMHDSLGIGLAAPQFGVANRVLVYRVEPESPINAVINPVVEFSSRDQEWLEEGCLSLPAVHVDVERPIHIRVRARDAAGEEILIEASGLEARVLQHEIDHLDGVLILDRCKRDQRRPAMRAMREALEQLEDEAGAGAG